MISLAPLTPQQCYESWEWIRKGIQECINRTAANYLPEDVYARIRAATAWLYMIDDIGFAVLTQEHDPDGLCMFIWVLWTEPGKGAQVEDGIYEALEKLAQQIRAVRIRMQSPRKGWERRKFFVPIATVFEHEVVL